MKKVLHYLFLITAIVVLAGPYLLMLIPGQCFLTPDVISAIHEAQYAVPASETAVPESEVVIPESESVFPGSEESSGQAEETELTSQQECDCTYGVKEVVAVNATDSTEGRVDLVCRNCGKVEESYTIHPYSTYTVQYTDGHTEKIYGYFDNDEAQEAYKLLNAYRKSNGLSELNYNSTLQWASDQRAIDCITYFEHTRPNGKRWNTIISEWTYGGENIALGYTNASKVMTGWKNSPGHNSNMLYSTYQGVSISCFKQIEFEEGSSIPTVIKTTWSQNFTFFSY